VIDSYLSECHANGQDAQGSAGGMARPLKIVNNYLSLAENLMFGAPIGERQSHPLDIESVALLLKPLAWRARARGR